MADQMNGLEIENVRVMRGMTIACDNVTLSVRPGETLALLGPSGSGKTSLLRAIAGLVPLSAGKISFDGANLSTTDVAERRFGVMFQDLALFPNRNVAGNVEYPLKVQKVARHDREKRVSALLAQVGLIGKELREIGELSGGERQRVALARALASDPRLLLLDEPLGSLDRLLRERLALDLRSSLKASSLPSIVVTHDHDEAFLLADTVVLLRDGRVVQTGTPAEVWRSPRDEWVSDFIGNPLAVDVERRDCVLRTPWGNLKNEGADSKLRLSVPPVAVSIDPDGEWSGTVRSIRPRRDYLQVEVEGTGGAVLAAASDAPIAIGASVHLHVRVERLILFGA